MAPTPIVRLCVGARGVAGSHRWSLPIVAVEPIVVQIVSLASHLSLASIIGPIPLLAPIFSLARFDSPNPIVVHAPLLSRSPLLHRTPSLLWCPTLPWHSLLHHRDRPSLCWRSRNNTHRSGPHEAVGFAVLVEPKKYFNKL